ncbi:ATP-binding cassette domain-containing protein, partial [Enterococcus faecalis]|uniref:ABC transporter ATP-binding protein n=1 Tax=Enterococcus faecalis TaxID=1351 RepID=UPI0021DF809A
DREISDFSDKELSRIRNEAVGFVFQNFSLIETLTVEENIELPLLYSGLTPKEAKDRVHEVLTKVGLADKGKKHPKQHSGGQQQRVANASAIVNRPSFIIADETTGALDGKKSEEMLTPVQQVNNEGGTIILATADEEGIEYCIPLIKVRDGVTLDEVLRRNVRLFGIPPAVPF